jgi:hypothetical protein
MSFPQSREGITGTLRDQDDLLSLEESALAVRRLIAGVAGVLMKTTLVGQPAPIVARIYERMRGPQPGDLVLETSTMYRQSEDWYKGCGILLEHRIEWWETDDQFRQYCLENDENPATAERLTDHAWYIQYGPQPDDVCRWVNCDFVTIPTDPRGWDVPAGYRDGSATVFTRDSLIGGLADSGFQLRQP